LIGSPRPFVALGLFLAASSSVPAAAQGNGPWNQLCNVNNAGAWQSQTAQGSEISDSGRYVAFVSSFPIDPGANGWDNVYVHDFQTGTTAVASLGVGGVWGDYRQTDPAISSTGRFVAFTSTSTNLVPGNDPGFDPDVFVHDTQTGVTVRCSIGPAGLEPDDLSMDPDISGDGRYVSFVSPATNILPNPGAFRQVFVFDRVTGNMKMASSNASGVAGNGHSYAWHSVLSGDGRYCAFDTYASFSPNDTNGIIDVYCKDLVTGQIALVTADPATGQAGQTHSAGPSISGDGRFVAFATGDAWVPHDVNGLGTYDVYVRDMSSNAMTLVSVGLNGLAATGGGAAISADGKHVAFLSVSTNIVPNDNNGYYDAFVRDLALGQTTRESVSYAGGDPDHNADQPSISANGRRLAFTSLALNIVQGVPPSFYTNCYARDRGPSATPQAYCIAKVNSVGCTPAIGSTGVPSATLANAFHVTASNIVNHKVGTLFYSVVGPAQIPFQDGWLCVQLPRRTPGLLQSGGNSGAPDCSGIFDREFNAYIASGQDPALVAGQEIWMQIWSRDPASASTTNLTDALDALIGP
jgi:Tol biopolymer transport system component